ncbi:MAG: hypothetical protein Kow00104_05730 [Rhodothalassiaceae bacterium]
MLRKGKIATIAGAVFAVILLECGPMAVMPGSGEALAQAHADRAQRHIERREQAIRRLHRLERLDALRRIDRPTLRRIIEYRQSRAIAERRKAAIRALIRNHKGAWVMRHQILALVPDEAALDRLRPLGFRLARMRRFEALGFSVAVLGTPKGLEPDDALALARKTLPDIRFEAHHLFDPSGDTVTATSPMEQDGPLPWQGLPVAEGLKIGQIDLGVDSGHPALKGAHMILRSFVGAQEPVPSEHGTAIASLLVGRLGSFAGASSGAVLYAADVFGDGAEGGSVEAILSALDWMAAERVPVVAMPLAGPRNLLLELALDKVSAKGMLVVAPVGNDGPTMPVAWPAAHPAVVAVTATDKGGEVFLTAHRGPEVMLAAVGVGLPAAADPGTLLAVEGTSFAVPEVASRLLRLYRAPDPERTEGAILALMETARDLGTPGRDPVYGAGWVSYAGLPDIADATVQRPKE